jgi:hypothetical protein
VLIVVIAERPFLLLGFISGEGGAAKGGSDGAAREGGKVNKFLLVPSLGIVVFCCINKSYVGLCVRKADNHIQKCAHRF